MPFPPDAPPTAQEEITIAYWVSKGKTRPEAEELVLATRPKVKEAKPAGGPTPTEASEGALRNALQSLGIELEDRDFAAFHKVVRAEWVDARDAAETTDTWPVWIKTLAQRTAAPPPLVEGDVGLEPRPAPLERALDNWQAGQEQAQFEAQQEKEALKREGQRLKAAEKAEEFDRAQFKDALSALAKRFPGNKNIITNSEVQARLWNEWQAAKRRQQADLESIPPELREALVGLQAPDIPIGSFVRSLDWAQFAEQNGLGPQWQQGLFDDAFDRNIAEPLRQGAKTAAEKLAAEDRIAQLEKAASPALKAQFRQATEEQPDLTLDAFLASDTAKGILGEATRQSQTRIEPGEELTGRQRRQQEQEAAYAMTLQGRSPAEIADRLNITENDARQLSQAGAAARQFFTGQATVSGGRPAGEVRGGEFGQDIFPQYIRTPLTSEQLGARNAALEALSPEWRAKQREADIRAANQFNLEAARQAREGAAGAARAEAQRLFGEVYGVTDPTKSTVTRPAPNLDALNPQEVERYTVQLQGQLAKKQEREATLTAFKPVLDDTGFAPELDRFVAENRKITYAGNEFAPEDVYESREDVLARSAPRVASLYGAYQARKRQQPAARRIPRVL